jgi:hypothetical protein
MSFARVVLFTDEVATRPLQRDFGRVGKVRIVIDYQDARLLLIWFHHLREKICFDCSVHNFSSDICGGVCLIGQLTEKVRPEMR